MGHPVTTSEQLLQQAVDLLTEVRDLLRQGQTPTRTAAAPAEQGILPPAQTSPREKPAPRRRSSSSSTTTGSK